MKPGLLCVLLLTAISSYAQVVEVSNPTKLPPRTGKFKILGKNNDGIVVRLYGIEDVINVYDNNLKLASSKTIAFKNQDGLLQHIMLNKTGSVMFYLMQDKKFSVLYAQPVSSKFTEMGKPLAVDTIYDRRDLVASNLRFKTSVDQNYLFIYYPFFSGGVIQSTRFICLDRALNVVFNRNVPMNRDEGELEESKSLVDNEGNCYLVLKPQKKNSPPQYDVFRVSPVDGATVYSIYTQQPLFGEPLFETDNKNGQLVMSAFFKDESMEEDVANGFVFGIYDPKTGEVIQSSKTTFPKQFMNDLTGREQVDMGKLYTFVIKKVVLRNDGGAMVVAESFIRDTRESAPSVGVMPGFNTFRTSTIYQFNDIIAFTFEPDGKLAWNTIMRKKQPSEDDNGAYSSFLIVNEKDKLHFVYLDDITSAATLNEYILTSDGKSERKSIINQEEKDVMLLPKVGKQISPPRGRTAQLQERFVAVGENYLLASGE